MEAICEVCQTTFDDSKLGYTLSVDRRSKTGLSMGHSYCCKDHLVKGVQNLEQ
jgi:hypothetical protein